MYKSKQFLLYFHSVDAPLIALQTSDLQKRKAQESPADADTDSDTRERTRQDNTIRDDPDDVLGILSIAYM